MFKKRQVNDQNFQDACVSVIQSGDLQALKNLLYKQRRIDADTPIGRLGLTLLHLAVVFGQPEITDWLIQSKANLEVKEFISGKTPLHLAAYYGRMDVLELLLKHARGFSVDKAKCSPIHYACMQEDLDVVRLLIRKFGEPNAPSNIGTPLEIAIRKKNFALADFLSGNIGLSSLVRRELDLESYLNPVFFAIASGQKDVAMMLLHKFPQFPSQETKRIWRANDLLEGFFSIPSRGEFLEFFYSSEEGGFVQNRVELWVNERKSEFLKDGSLLEVFSAILDGDLERLKAIVNAGGFGILTAKGSGSTPIEFAEEVCFFPLFEWLIEKHAFPEKVGGFGFFSKWCLMELDPSSGVFFHLIPKNLEVLNLRYHVMQE